jgi:hypothetical protein
MKEKGAITRNKDLFVGGGCRCQGKEVEEVKRGMGNVKTEKKAKGRMGGRGSTGREKNKELDR